MMPIGRNLSLCMLALLFAGVVGANNVDAMMPEKGMLLVANEQLADPRFHDRVILLIQNDTQGTAGLWLTGPVV